jgi:tetratricopeptide (TPR) repeat protein
MATIDGLYPYEVAMLVAGSLLFIVALVLTLVIGLQGKSIKGFVVLFFISIVMIGFPAYSNIEISADGLKLQKAVHTLQDDPTNAAARQTIDETVPQLQERPINNLSLLTTIAGALFASGETEQAEAALEKILKSGVQNRDALELKNKIDVNNNLIRLTEQVKQNPTDEVAKTQLNQAVEDATKLKIASPAMLTNLAQGQEAIGQKAAAKENLKIVTAIDRAGFGPIGNGAAGGGAAGKAVRRHR